MSSRNKHAEAIVAESHRRDGRRDISHFADGMTSHDVGRLLADQEGNRGKRDEKYLLDRWVRSSEFVPMELPVEMLFPVRIPSGRTRSFTTGPIVVEINFRGVGQIDPRIEKTRDNPRQENGFFPPYVIIDGQHRWYTAMRDGQEMIHAVVGLRAIPLVVAELIKWASAKRKGTK